ncbi:9347_t:CDS:2, partial [Scutellospora calospora]
AITAVKLELIKTNVRYLSKPQLSEKSYQVHFGVGDRIPADIRFVMIVNLEIDESNLTGETKPRKKGIDTIQFFLKMIILIKSIRERKNITSQGL